MSRVVIIGAGLAGLSCALKLRELLPKKKIEIFERTKTAHHKVCGEYLSFESELGLKSIGISVADMGAVPMTKGTVHGKKTSMNFSLSQRAWGLSRKVLDQRMIDLCEQRGIFVHRGRVIDYDSVAQGYSETNSEDLIYPDDKTQIVLAHGKRDLAHGTKRSSKSNNWVGYKMHLEVDPEMIEKQNLNGIQLFQSSTGYFGISPSGPSTLNVCAAFRIGDRSDYPKLQDFYSWLRQFSHPAISNWIHNSQLDASSLCAVSPIPYGYVWSSRDFTNELNSYRVGDQIGCIPSLCGDGMSIAINSGLLCAFAIAGGEKASEFNLRLSKLIRNQIKVGMILQKSQTKSFLFDTLLGIGQKIPSFFSLVHSKTRCTSLLKELELKG